MAEVVICDGDDVSLVICTACCTGCSTGFRSQGRGDPSKDGTSLKDEKSAEIRAVVGSKKDQNSGGASCTEVFGQPVHQTLPTWFKQDMNRRQYHGTGIIYEGFMDWFDPSHCAA